MARRRCLPFIPAEASNPEQNLGDLPLGGALAQSVKSLQHAMASSLLLRRQASVGRDGAAMQRREKPKDRFNPIKSIHAERYRRDYTPRTVADDLEALAMANIDQHVCLSRAGH